MTVTYISLKKGNKRVEPVTPIKSTHNDKKLLKRQNSKRQGVFEKMLQEELKKL